MEVRANLTLNQILVNEYSYKLIHGDICAGCSSSIITLDDTFNEESYKDEFANTIRKMLDSTQLGESAKFEFISGNNEIFTISLERKTFK